MTGRRLADWLWLPIVLVFCVPVLLHVTSHHGLDAATEQGSLVLGRTGLDSLLAGSIGKPVIVNLWATWCTPCVGELPHIDRVHSSMEGAVMAIAVDIGDPDIANLLEFREEVNLAMPMVWLDAVEVEALKRDWELADVLPITIILDTSGKETGRVLGSRSEEFFLEAVSGALIEDPGSEAPESDGLHIIVAGDPSDSLTAALLEVALDLAGEDGVEAFDPTDPAGVSELSARFLPLTGSPYAQPCVGDACGRLSRTVEDLVASVESLIP